MLRIRPFSYTDSDYARAIAINAAVFREPADTLAEWRHDDQSLDKRFPFLREMVLRGDTVIAYVETSQNQFAYHPQKYRCLMFVDPSYEASDIRPHIFAHTLHRLRDQNLIALTSGMLDSIPEAMHFFDSYGFDRVAEEKLSKLDVTGFDANHYIPQLDRVRAANIDIIPLRDLQRTDPNWQWKLYDLEITVNQDIPALGEKHYPTFENWRKMRLHAPTFDADAWFIALDGTTYVGQSQGSINREGQPVQFITGVTTTRREYRRRGIATALKVNVIQYAQSQGVQEIFTTNDSQNPMYRLNLTLGFQPLPSWIRFEKSLDQPTGNDAHSPSSE